MSHVRLVVIRIVVGVAMTIDGVGLVIEIAGDHPRGLMILLGSAVLILAIVLLYTAQRSNTRSR